MRPMPSRSLQQLLTQMRDLPEFVEVTEVNVNSAGNFGNPPLHIAAIRGDVEAGELLLEAGADLNARGEHGYTALHQAVEQGHSGFAALLISRGANTSLKNEDGETAYAIVQKSEDSPSKHALESLFWTSVLPPSS